jgi:K+/H+ antiporter YhaU regulatory subunit KhtT
MADEVRVEELYGIGKRYDIPVSGTGQRLSVVLHKDGRREVYVLGPQSDEPLAVIELDDEQALRVAAVLSGTYFAG